MKRRSYNHDDDNNNNSNGDDDDDDDDDDAHVCVFACACVLFFCLVVYLRLLHTVPDQLTSH